MAHPKSNEMKEILDALRRTIKKTQNNGHRNIIFPVADAKRLIEHIDPQGSKGTLGEAGIPPKMSKPKFNPGDWCFCEFELRQIKEMSDDRITCVTDGYFSHGGNDLADRCFPIEMKIKQSSDEVETWYKDIRQVAGKLNINYPDIRQKFIELWVHLCENTEDEILYTKYWKELQEFGSDLSRKLGEMKYEEVHGIKIIK
jgi:hypothetical protein